MIQKAKLNDDQRGVSRRDVLGAIAGGAAIAAAGSALPAMAASRPFLQQMTSTITDTDIVNFALNLEYLEAEFYTYGLTGRGIEHFGIPTSSGVGRYGPTTGGSAVPGLTPLVKGVTEDVMEDEVAHVKLLRSLLGSAAIAKPAINLAAAGLGFGDQEQFLVLSRKLEDTGVTAYNGAAPLLSSKTILSYASRILGTEAEHSGNIRLLVAEYGYHMRPLDAKDILPPPSGTFFFSVDSNGLTIARTVAEVLALVTPFFPNGLNGTIH